MELSLAPGHSADVAAPTLSVHLPRRRQRQPRLRVAFPVWVVEWVWETRPMVFELEVVQKSAAATSRSTSTRVRARRASLMSSWRNTRLTRTTVNPKGGWRPMIRLGDPRSTMKTRFRDPEIWRPRALHSLAGTAQGAIHLICRTRGPPSGVSQSTSAD